MRDNKLVVGFIGNGKSCHRYQAPFILRRPEKYIIKTIYGRSDIKAPWTKIPGVHYTKDIDEVLKDPEIDVVVISLPAAVHYEFSKLCLEAGKHVVCEKPFVETAQRARELYALAEEKGLIIQAYQNRRFDSDFLTTQKVIESGRIGKPLELEMHFDYYRPETPEKTMHFDPLESYFYGHACHTLDQVVSYFGVDFDKVHYDVRQLLGPGRLNDYFDIDLYYGVLKVSVKSSYFRVQERPSFIIYGTRGMFVKQLKDKQEKHLKEFYDISHEDFGVDTPEEYGQLIWYDEEGARHEEAVPTVTGDYARYYDALYETIVNGAPKLIKDIETLTVLGMLEEGIKLCK